MKKRVVKIFVAFVLLVCVGYVPILASNDTRVRIPDELEMSEVIIDFAKEQAFRDWFRDFASQIFGHSLNITGHPLRRGDAIISFEIGGRQPVGTVGSIEMQWRVHSDTVWTFGSRDSIGREYIDGFLIFREDGSLYGWGNNSNGRLGDDTTQNRATPVRIMGDLFAVNAIFSSEASGIGMVVALGNDGNLWTWGSNTTGLVGDGTTNDRRSPYNVMTSIVTYSAIEEMVTALRSDGTLWIWGGQYGIRPIQIFDNVVELTPQFGHGWLALRADGSLWAWGQPHVSNGNLSFAEPTLIVNNFTVSHFSDHTFIADDGEEWRWFYFLPRLHDVVLIPSTGGNQPNPGITPPIGTLTATGLTYPQVGTVRSNLNLRHAPSSDADTFGSLWAGAQVFILEGLNNGWFRVQTQAQTWNIRGELVGNKIGYMSSEFVDMLPIAPISAYGHRVAEEFLRTFVGGFQQRGWRNSQTGSFYFLNESWELVLIETFSDYMPMYYMGYTVFSDELGTVWSFDGNLYNRSGRLVANTSAIRDMLMADSFSLYDLDGNGIPEIVVHFGNQDTSGWFGVGESVIFRYVNGSYIEVGTLIPGYIFFTNERDEIILLYDNDYYGIHRYYSVRFIGTGMELTNLYSLPEWSDSWVEQWSSWYEHHVAQEIWSNPNPIMYGTGQQLTRLFANLGLQEVIRQSLLNPHSQDVLIIDNDDMDAIYPTPNDGINVNTPTINEIISIITSWQMHSDETTSAEAGEHAALQLEDIIKRSSTHIIEGEPGSIIRLTAVTLNSGTNLAGSLYEYVNSLADISSLRTLERNLNFVTNQSEELIVLFPDDVRGINFNNVTVAAVFASFTISHDFILAGNEVSIRRTQSTVAFEQPNEETTLSSNFGLATLLNFWSVAAVTLIIVIWLILHRCGKRFRLWVVPTLVCIALAANVYTLFIAGDGLAAETQPSIVIARDDTFITAVEIAIPSGMQITLSLPAPNGDFAVYSEQGELQNATLNPITGMIDVLVQENRVIALYERASVN